MVKIHNLCKQLGLIGLTACLVGVSAHSAAGDGGYYPNDRYSSDGYDYATVTSVIPVYNDIQVVEPRTQCWDQTVTYQQPSPAGAIIGGLIGAAVGRDAARGYRHGWGRHSHYHRGNKGAGMVAGAAVGAVIGNAVSSHNAPVQYGTEQRCQVVEQVNTRRELVGYDVNYQYNGQTYLIRTNQHPGDRIRVRVDVTPVM